MKQNVAVILPCYSVRQEILGVLQKIGTEVHTIIVVDDACPQNTGQWVKDNFHDPRLIVLELESNQGVGGAVMAGFKKALELESDILVKLDGDGQMDPRAIPQLIHPLAQLEADCTKGNRFYAPEYLVSMPKLRLLGNGFLSFINKLVSGYWNIMDPTNGFLAIQSRIVPYLPLEKIDKGYFFESDILVRLNILRAVVQDIPMKAFYGNEKSHLRISRVLFHFPGLYWSMFWKRIFYNYFLRDFNLGSVSFLLGSFLLLFGASFGAWKWIEGSFDQTNATAGTVMLSALPVILGFQLLLFGLQIDILSVPKTPLIQNLLHKKK